MLESLTDLLEGNRFYEFTSFPVALFSLLLAFVLSTLIAITYRITYVGREFPNHFFQAMVLSSLVSGMIMMAVGSNFAVGFGIIGAVAIIRFRTLISDPRNIIFMFAGISVGIATGVFGYAIALAGSIIFCSTACLLHFSPFGSRRYPRIKILIIAERGTDPVLHESEILKFTSNLGLKSIRKSAENKNRYDYTITVNEPGVSQQLFSSLSEMNGLLEVKVEEGEANKTDL